MDERRCAGQIRVLQPVSEPGCNQPCISDIAAEHRHAAAANYLRLFSASGNAPDLRIEPRRFASLSHATAQGSLGERGVFDQYVVAVAEAKVAVRFQSSLGSHDAANLRHLVF